jgi:hypothetical protein
MFCSTCGATVTPGGVSYCNRCGAGLILKEPSLPQPKQPPADQLIWAIVGTFVGGMGVIIGLLALMKEKLNFSSPLIVGFALLSFLILVAVEIVFIWLLVRSQKQVSATGEVAELKKLVREVDATTAGALREPPLSVTDQTTRTLEPVERKRQTQ